MIPGLLHPRLLAAGVADPPSFDGISLFHSKTGFGAGAKVK